MAARVGGIVAPQFVYLVGSFFSSPQSDLQTQIPNRSLIRAMNKKTP